jgi:lipopolysaccharide export system protein LptA
MNGFNSNNSATKTTLFLLLFVVTAFIGIPQTPSTTDNSRITRVQILRYDSLEMQMNDNPDVYVFLGNVVFLHDSIYMYSDSAYLYNLTNSLEAFDNVRIEQGDTLFIYGDYLNYYGNTQLAKMRNNVKMENNEVTLFTDSFDYDRRENLAYYFDGGMLLDSVNELTSVYGQYSPDTKIAFFIDRVRLVNPQFVLTSDTLVYHTETKIATFVSPTVIESDSGYIYTDRGWYNTVSGESMLYDRSLVVSKDQSKTITADSMAYSREEGFLEAFGNMILNDTVRKVIVMGNYGYYDEITDFAFATDSAQMIEYSQRDSTFLHADTIKMTTIDTIREIRAYYGARFYRTDLQGVADSIQYSTADTILRLYRNPILWNEAFQITGDTINILFNDSTVERMHVLNYAFVSEEVDSTYYNQLKGRNLTAYFDAGELHQLVMEGNGEALYYLLDAVDAAPLQLSKTAAPFITFWINNRKIVRGKWDPEPTHSVYPLPDLTPELKFLQNFVDYNYLRPKSREDIFVKTEMRAEDIPPPRRVRQRSQQE